MRFVHGPLGVLALLLLFAAPLAGDLRKSETKLVRDVIGMKWSDATYWMVMDGFDFELKLDWDCPSDRLGKITKQDPVGGTAAPKGTVVTLWYMPSGRASTDVWERGEVQIIPREGGLPEGMEATATSLSYTVKEDGKSWSSTMSWSEPPAVLRKGDTVALTLTCSVGEDGPYGPPRSHVAGRWDQYMAGTEIKGTDSASDWKKWRDDDPHHASCTFTFDPTEGFDNLIRMNCGRFADTSDVRIFWVYRKKAPGSAATQPFKKRVTDLTPNEFFADTDEARAAQRELYDIARKMLEVQRSLAEGRCRENGIPTGTDKFGRPVVDAKLKRDDFNDFIEGIRKKFKRNEGRPEYDERIGRMDDIVRGRFNLRSAKDVEAVVRSLGDDPMLLRILQIEGPRRPQDGGGHGYPRWHIIMEDLQTGLRFEWQIGTGAVTEVYEKEGIRIPENVRLPPGMRRDVHDIEYDIFAGIAKRYPDLHLFYELPLFQGAVETLSADAGLHGDDAADLGAKIERIHDVAGDKLQVIVNDKGPEWLERFYH